MLVFAGPTDIQQTTFAVSTGFQMVFNTGSLAVSTDSTGLAGGVGSFSTGFLNWLSNRFSTSCDWLAVEFSRGVAIVARKKEESRPWYPHPGRLFLAQPLPPPAPGGLSAAPRGSIVET